LITENGPEVKPSYSFGPFSLILRRIGGRQAYVYASSGGPGKADLHGLSPARRRPVVAPTPVGSWSKLRAITRSFDQDPEKGGAAAAEYGHRLPAGGGILPDFARGVGIAQSEIDLQWSMINST
jgi:hypothetical protein